MNRPHLTQSLRNAGFVLFDSSYSAERNLEGRTRYYSADTRRFHGSREVFNRAFAYGLILGTIESYAVDYEKTRRAFRPMFFDLDGWVIGERRALEDGFRTKAQAVKEFWRVVDTLDTEQITRDMLARLAKRSIESASSYLAILASEVTL
jgi:hypothetical protein